MKYNLVLPIAGDAKRFLNAGYLIPKPLIVAHNKHIIEWALSSIKYDECNLIFVVRLEHIYNFSIDKILKQKFGHNIIIVPVDHLTEGSVCTCLLAKTYIDTEVPLIIYTPDVYFEPQFDPSTLPKTDGSILTFKANNPAHSYARIENGFVTKTAEKRVISQNAAVGVYTFKYGKDFIKYAHQMIENNDRINNEFYICPIYNYLIRDGLKISIQEIDKMHVLGTPEDMEFFVNNVSPKFNQAPIALCADHSGFELKEICKEILTEMNIKYIDFGTYANCSCDYYDFESRALHAIQQKICYFGMGFCRTGQGMNIAANKQTGIYSALLFNDYSAEYAVRHNAANFFAIPSLIIGRKELESFIHIIQNNSFDGGRHFTRIRKFAK